jgi:hypothetical protein
MHDTFTNDHKKRSATPKVMDLPGKILMLQVTPICLSRIDEKEFFPSSTVIHIGNLSNERMPSQARRPVV